MIYCIQTYYNANPIESSACDIDQVCITNADIAIRSHVRNTQIHVRHTRHSNIHTHLFIVYIVLYTIYILYTMFIHT